jgi:hypothetical protein
MENKVGYSNLHEISRMNIQSINNNDDIQDTYSNIFNEESKINFYIIDNTSEEYRNLNKLKKIIVALINKTLFIIHKYNFFACLLLFTASITYYYLSLKGCPRSFLMMQCLAKFGQKDVYELIGYIIKSAYLFSIIITFFIKKVFLCKKLFVFISVILIYSLFIYDTGLDLYSHGAYNSKFFVVFCVLSVLLNILLSKLLILLILRTKFILIIATSTFVIAYLMYNSFITTSCEYWDKGFKNTKINNDEIDSCEINKPKLCWFTIFDGVFDYPRIINQDCTANKTIYNSDDLLIHTNLTKDSLYIGYPNTNNYHLINDTHVKVFQKKILSEFIDLTNLKSSISEKKYELSIDFRNFTLSNQIFNTSLTLNKNYSLEAERNITYNNFKESVNNKTLGEGNLEYLDLVQNVVVIFFDSLSRPHFKRKLPNVFNWLEENYNNKTSDYSSYQFFKFQSLYPGTLANIVSAYYGAFPGNRKGYSIYKKFQERGFVVAQTMDLCGREYFDIEKDLNFTYHYPDHELASLFCDPTFYDISTPYKMFSGPYGMGKRCIWGREAADWMFDYSRQFMESYKNSSKFLSVGIQDSHEGSGEMVKYTEEYVLNFLNYLKKEKILDNTLLLIFSDHGFFMPGSVYQLFNLNDFQIEQTLPSLYMLLPKNIKGFEKIDKSLKSNENKMITTFDIYQTISSIVGNYKNSKSGENLFEKTKSGKSTNCKSLKISDENCRCMRKD